MRRVVVIMLVAKVGFAQSARDEAVRLFDTQEYAAAADRFKQCYQVDHDAACLYGLGQSLRALGDCPRAIEAYRAFMRTSPPADKHEKARLNIEACERGPRVVAAAPPPPPPPVKPESPWSRDRFLAPLVIGAGVTALAGGTFFVLGSREHDAAAEEGRGSGALQTFEDHRARADLYQRIASAAVFVSGALAVAALARYVIYEVKADTRTSTTVTVSGSWIGLESRF